MADEQSSELVRELRRIRYILAGILILLALHLCQVAVHRWQDSHDRVAPISRAQSQEFRDIHGGLRAIHDELSNQRNPPPVVIPGEKLAMREGNQSE
jgi:hypothetical protein